MASHTTAKKSVSSNT